MNAFEIIPLSERDLDSIIKLRHIILASLTDPDIFYVDTKEYTANLLKYNMVLGCFTEGNLIAYEGIMFVIDNDENLGRDINLPECELSNVAYIDVIAVHPFYRENDLGHCLNTEAVNVIRDRGKHHILATVSPKNIASINMFLKLGMKIKKHTLKYDGLERYIMHMEI